MVFSSSVFLFAFLPLFLLVYFALPWRAVRNVVLLLFSLVFYAWGEPIYVWLMVFSIVMNWGFAFAMSATSKKPHGGLLFARFYWWPRSPSISSSWAFTNMKAF